MKKGAIISECGKYRYRLWRIWDESKPKVMFIMLNPSLADAERDDPTIRRCINFAISWGFGGIYVGNIHPYRSTDPRKLKKVMNTYGKNNVVHIVSMLDKCQVVVCAWGNNERPPEYFKELSKLHYLELSKNGTPKHPLYLKADLKPKKYRLI
ncbi:DUF1643 domain-containing protein [Aquimarina sp. 2201CG5-10]|uniref:DUF1643 domain-containing protein n=1 Tax=Aquimarina callyspongiae TaxID=3098150 RepID=UPI002AB36BA9|nr:DUF1643 domain-containing protein [Aquimarina sp. 2201CG5-10]MDY8137584.1 DUF1643 domain-containing protein [Aquimarina sp. 2201CG5-10]